MAKVGTQRGLKVRVIDVNGSWLITFINHELSRY